VPDTVAQGVWGGVAELVVAVAEEAGPAGEVGSDILVTTALALSMMAIAYGSLWTLHYVDRAKALRRAKRFCLLSQ